MEKYLTPEGLEKIKKELKELKTVKRKEISEKLTKAISFGDLSENAAYSEAKEAQAFLEGKISELENLIHTAKVVEKEKKSGWVQIGSVVIVNSGGNVQKFEIVGATESDPSLGKISNESPLGRAFLDKPVGATVEVQTPKGTIKYKIVKIE